MAKKLALGKGMASLIQATPNEILKESLEENFPTPDQSNKGEKQNKKLPEGPVMLHVDDIHANPNQPRKIFKDKEIDELAQSIKENGIIQPLIVSKKEDGDGFDLIAGERRLRASKKAGLEQVPVVIKKATEREKVIMAIIENVQRSDLNPVEEALAYYQLMDEYKLTQEEVAKKLGKERSSIANFLRILKLPREVVDMIQKEFLSFGHAKVLASIKDADKTIRFANMAVSKGLTVRELEKEIKSAKNSVDKDKESSHSFFDEKLEDCREKLESKTGFHFNLNSKQNGSGQVMIKFNNEAEFNDIYEYLLSK